MGKIRFVFYVGYEFTVSFRIFFRTEEHIIKLKNMKIFVKLPFNGTRIITPPSASQSGFPSTPKQSHRIKCCEYFTNTRLYMIPFSNTFFTFSSCSSIVLTTIFKHKYAANHSSGRHPTKVVPYINSQSLHLISHHLHDCTRLVYVIKLINWSR